MRKIATSLVTIFAVVVMVAGSTQALFSDTVTSNENTFSAGTLDLQVDSQDNNVVKFNVSNIKPGSQPKGSWTVANVGNINGYLDIENVSVVSNENGCTSAENAASDPDCGTPGNGEGELDQLLNLRLFVDRDGDGWIGAGDTVFYNGSIGSVVSSYDLNEPINAGSNTTITAIVDWWPSSNDNLGQGDDLTLDLSFELGQNTSQ